MYFDAQHVTAACGPCRHSSPFRCLLRPLHGSLLLQRLPLVENLAFYWPDVGDTMNQKADFICVLSLFKSVKNVTICLHDPTPSSRSPVTYRSSHLELKYMDLVQNGDSWEACGGPIVSRRSWL